MKYSVGELGIQKGNDPITELHDIISPFYFTPLEERRSADNKNIGDFQIVIFSLQETDVRCLEYWNVTDWPGLAGTGRCGI